MPYLYYCFSISGWIATAVFFTYLACVTLWRRQSAQRESFSSVPNNPDAK